MTGRSVVWIPYRGDGDWRDRNFELAYAQASSLGLEVIVADSGHEPFSIANTWNLCAELSPPDWLIALRWAADFILVDVASAEEALEHPSHYTFAFDRVTTLDRVQTAQMHRGETARHRPGRLPFGGINKLTRAAWDAVGGYDPRFLGWGHEDRAFVHALEVLGYTRARVPGHMLNLWHPKRRHRPSDLYFTRRDANRRLLDEYLEIADPADMRAYLARLQSTTENVTVTQPAEFRPENEGP